MLPETPSSLIERGRNDEGRAVLRRLRGTDGEHPCCRQRERDEEQLAGRHPWNSDGRTCWAVPGCPPLAEVDAEMSDISAAVVAASQVKNEWTTIFKRRYTPQLVISMLIPTFQQWTGINAIM